MTTITVKRGGPSRPARRPYAAGGWWWECSCGAASYGIADEGDSDAWAWEHASLSHRTEGTE